MLYEVGNNPYRGFPTSYFSLAMPPMPVSYRFTLQPYAGKNSRTACPACGKSGCFARYLDTKAGILLGDEYGRCDHEVKCGYHLSPYKRVGNDLGHTKWIGAETKQTVLKHPLSFITVQTKPETHALSIPQDIFKSSLTQYEHNVLARVLQEHFGWYEAKTLIARFRLGTSVYWPGACVFWLIDEESRVRGGQIVLYDDTARTVKHNSDGSSRRHTTWAHIGLMRTYRLLEKPLPFWLTEYQKYGQKCPCLFGLPQLITAPAAQPIALVESAKTAILATPYFPQYIWMATMGLSYLTADRLKPLHGRRIVLFPDAGAFDKWQAKANALQPLGFSISLSNYLESTVTPVQRAAGYDLGDLILDRWPGYPPNWDERTI